jgi:hypothetical protein
MRASMTDQWDLIYDLRADAERVRQVQDASLNRPGYGFPTTPYLFGSAEWWSAIDSGAIERRRVDGIISAVYWGSIGDWPEFRLRPDRWVGANMDARRRCHALRRRVASQNPLRSPRSESGRSRTITWPNVGRCTRHLDRAERQAHTTLQGLPREP